MAQIQYIKDLFENEDLSLREISRRTNHSFNTVKKYAYQDNWGEGGLPNLEPESYPVLGEFIPIIDEWLEADRKVPRKQRHTMWRMYCRLRDSTDSPEAIPASSAMCARRSSPCVLKAAVIFPLPIRRAGDR